MQRLGRLLLLVAIFGAIAALACWAMTGATGWRSWQLPDRWNPFAPLTIDEAPGLLTRYKLARLGAEPERCLTTLATSAFRFKAMAESSAAPGCTFDNAVRIERSSVALSSPFTLSCPAAVALALWERHVVQAAAERHFGQPVVRLEHVGSTACRNIYGQADAPRSEHASANALDVSGFVLKSGQRITVGAGWNRGNDASAFLHESRDGACEFFSAVLSPDYNAAHAGHLHLDLGPYRVCR